MQDVAVGRFLSLTTVNLFIVERPFQKKSTFYFQEFVGNADQDTVVYHKLSHAIRARYIRFRPTAWHGQISMRVEVYGCKGNAVFSSTKLAYHFMAVLFHTRQKLTPATTKKQNNNKTKTKKPRRPALRSYKISVNKIFLPALKITPAEKLRQRLVYSLAL